MKQLCEMMGGSISVESQAGEGSCFRFDLRLEKSSGSQKVCPSVDIKGVPLVVVDDNTSNREIITRQLNAWGAQAFQIDSAHSALAIIDGLPDAGNG